ncbi:MAG: TldD/PmbA family protein [Candidatus Eisenbacteria bacterium]|nr:TldD/PmbA family protein [Candidatus Eisenbacteria bacterium]
MRELLREIVGNAKHWTEVRVHDRNALRLAVRNGVMESASSNKGSGAGVRVLVDGTWGFSSTARLDRESIERAVRDATLAAKGSAGGRKARVDRLADCEFAVGDFRTGDAEEIASHSAEEKTALVVDTERRTMEASETIRSAMCRYTELLDKKWVVSTDGADAHIEDAKLEFVAMAVAGTSDDMTTAFHGTGVTGGWPELFGPNSAEEIADKTGRTAVDLLNAPYAPGGKTQVVLDPELVGLLAHEAIGHTVEADFVLAGSAAAGRIGERVASELVTLCDSGPSVIGGEHAGGVVLVDDEGVPAGRTAVIENGVLSSYLHDRETAALFDVAPTGNARAWLFDDPPLIRMRNTYIEPGGSSFEEMVESIDDGLLLKGGGSGQADANAEFMFGVQEAYEIKRGKVGRLLRGASISGDAFEVLQSVDMLSSDFRWTIGSGHCGKGQPAKVDGGGPFVRCNVIVGGR